MALPANWRIELSGDTLTRLELEGRPDVDLLPRGGHEFDRACDLDICP